jgi:ferritin-like metal-binding protein YciE
MEGLIKEAEKYVNSKNADPLVRDAALIAAAQRVEHYEISGYGTARAYAITLEFMEDARLLKQSLDEESRTDEKLTTMAESHINEQAIA